MVKKNKDAFDEIIAERENYQTKMDTIKGIVEDKIARNINIDSIL